jgi:hypothetical protein
MRQHRDTPRRLTTNGDAEALNRLGGGGRSLDIEEPHLEDEHGVGREDARHSADLEEHTLKILAYDDLSLILPPVLDKLPRRPHVR